MYTRLARINSFEWNTIFVKTHIKLCVYNFIYVFIMSPGSKNRHGAQSIRYHTLKRECKFTKAHIFYSKYYALLPHCNCKKKNKQRMYSILINIIKDKYLWMMLSKPMKPKFCSAGRPRWKWAQRVTSVSELNYSGLYECTL